MYTTILVALLPLAPLIADAGGTARCTTREDPALQRWVTECTDGSRAVSRWDAGLQRWQIDITKAPKVYPPRGWPVPRNAP